MKSNKKEAIRKAALLLRIADNKFGIKIINTLNSRGGPMCVTDIHKAAGMDQALCSQMLSRMKIAGLVGCKRKGKQVFYSLHRPTYMLIDLFCSGLIDTRS